MSDAVEALGDDTARLDALVALNNASVRETSLLDARRLGWMIGRATVATTIAPARALLLAYDQDSGFDGGHFKWFCARLPRFLYIDRVVVAAPARRQGLGQLLYGDLFVRAHALGHDVVTCEVNLDPPNPISDAFHAQAGFAEMGRFTFPDGAKTVRYLVRGSDG